ncbi:DEKNAAC101634 [Brettanomyces naardenensis]|uniref:DEKNAAC101634 n=1 Tax=Brettanomyces naardenensis TaxID=13370 RepID=A0A448YIE6_BRENA|nr:DEKNAAC101634 [Brettanomyces naardenensis]
MTDPYIRDPGSTLNHRSVSSFSDKVVIHELQSDDVLGLSDNDDRESNPEQDTDFVEFRLDKNRQGSVCVIDHNLSKIAEEYEARQVENMDIDPIRNASSASLSAVSTSSSISASSTASSSYDDWKEMETQIDSANLYDQKGENILAVFNGKVSVGEPKSRANSSLALWRPKSSKDRSNSSVSNLSSDIMVQPNDSSRSLSSVDGSRGAGQNYTRIAMEGQATKFMEMDKRFEFLFQNENDNLRKLRGSTASLERKDIGDDDSDSDSDAATFANFKMSAPEAEKEMTVDNQLLTTQSMLTGSQKIAYAALVKLTMVEQHVKLNEIRGSGSTKVMKKLAKSQKSFTRWSMNVMEQLYEHLGIVEPREQSMIENLSCHGIETDDLVKWFDTNLVVKNSLKKIDEEDSEKDVQMIDMKSDDSFDIDIRWTLICDLFLILLESSVYDSRSRTLMIQFAKYLGIENLEVYQFERRITGALEMDEITAMVNNQKTWNEKDLLKEHKKKGRGNKMVKIAFATVAGGLVIGLSAGALAPVIGAGVAAGFSTIGIAGTAGIFAGTAGTSVITAGGILTGMRIGQKGMENRVGSVKTFEFKPLHNNGRFNLILTVSGWMSGKMDDVRLPFSTVDPVMGDMYSLLWEPDMLTSMGQTIQILANEILTQSIQQILGATILVTLMGAIQLPMWLSKLSYLLDNPWSVSLNRAKASGLILADTLRRNKLGVRPITLVGFSLGAKVIFTCLQSLAKSGDYGLIENVYIFGAPVVLEEDSIALARSVISGRFVNGYSKQDWILGYLFRATSGGLRNVAGLSPIEGVENIDCTSMVKGHMEYRKVMPRVLKMLGWEVLSDEFVEIQEADSEVTERQRKLISDFEKAQSVGDKKKTWYGKWFGKKNKEWWEMYGEGMKEREEESSTETDKSLFDVDALQREVAKIEAKAKEETTDKSPPKTPDLSSDLRAFKTPQAAKEEHHHKLSMSESLESSDGSGSRNRINFNVVDTSPTNGNDSPELKPLNLSPDESQRTGLDAGLRSLRVGRGSNHALPSFNLAAVKGIDVVESKPWKKHIANVAVEEGEKEKIRISFGDELERINEEEGGEKSSKNASTGSLGIDYGDEEEFPHDESQLRVTFS